LGFEVFRTFTNITGGTGGGVVPLTQSRAAFLDTISNSALTSVLANVVLGDWEVLLTGDNKVKVGVISDIIDGIQKPLLASGACDGALTVTVGVAGVPVRLGFIPIGFAIVRASTSHTFTKFVGVTLIDDFRGVLVSEGAEVRAIGTRVGCTLTEGDVVNRGAELRMTIIIIIRNTVEQSRIGSTSTGGW
jgi:hypothetical protein